jgi:hypothetical protein
MVSTTYVSYNTVILICGRRKCSILIFNIIRSRENVEDTNRLSLVRTVSAKNSFVDTNKVLSEVNAM